MKRSLLLYASGLVLAAVLVIGFGRRGQGDLSRPLIRDFGPRGLAALDVYLREGGHVVSTLSAPDSALPEGTRTLVLAAPDARPVTREMWKGLEAFVRKGGTLVYLASNDFAASQPTLSEELGIATGKRLSTDEVTTRAGTSDFLGSTASVWLAEGPLRHARALRFAAGRGLKLEEDGTLLPVAGKGGTVALAMTRLGQGELWVAASSSLAENARLATHDNLAFWEALAQRGPLVFDERAHQISAAAPHVSSTGWLGLQLLVCAAWVLWAQGTRLGPARPMPRERLRSTLEYVESFARLTRRAGVEHSLVLALHAQLRATALEATGAPVTSDDEALDPAACAKARRPVGTYVALARKLSTPRTRGSVSAAEYGRLSQEVAALELALRGRE
jgi:hypothetical protein